MASVDEPGRVHRAAGAALVVGLVAFLPFVRGALTGQAFFFRDLSRHFFPLRRFAVEGLRHGELRFWNPLSHEGIPLPFLPVAYPLEVLQLLWPDEAGFSLLLALHVPLAALALFLLARHLGLAPAAAAGGALIYSLGGFGLSTLNLYVYVHAIAWAPLLVLALLRAGAGGARAVAATALLTAISLSTAGIEIVLQAALVGLTLAASPRDVRRWLRLLGGLALGAGLAAPVLLVMAGVTAGTERAQGFTPDVMLNQSVHPFTLLQVLVGSLYGDLGNLPNRWWGVNFFENGFPYILSLYLGPLVLSVAFAGSSLRHPLSRRILLLGGLGLAIALGRWGLPGLVADHVPVALRVFRFPTKAFFTVHVTVALLAAIGLDALAAAQARCWRRTGIAALVLGGLLALAPALPSLLPGAVRWFILHFFAPGTPWSAGVETLDEILRDAARGGLLAVLGGLTGLVVLAGRLRPALGSTIVVGLIAADLLRTGAGLNPTVSVAFHRVNPQVLAVVQSLPGRQRLYTCDPQGSRSYWLGRRLRPASHETYTFAVWMNTLAPNFNMPVGVPTALSEDLTSMVPRKATPPPGFSCQRFDEIAERLREAAVTHVLSLDPVESPHLELVAVVPAAEITPALVHVYALRGSLPWRSLRAPDDDLSDGSSIQVLEASTSETRLEARTAAPALLVMRDGFAPGWRAWVNGTPTAIEETRGHHVAVPVPAGSSRVVLRYVPPGLRLGLAVLFVSALGVGVLILRTRGRHPDPAASSPLG